jgi:hypothetical protein
MLRFKIIRIKSSNNNNFFILNILIQNHIWILTNIKMNSRKFIQNLNE